MLGIPEWALPALAQGATIVPFTDAPPAFPAPGPVNRQYDIRTIDGPFSPTDRFFTTQHYGHPVVEPAAFRLKLTGLVNRPVSLSLDELRKAGNTELIAGFECSGNRRPLQGLCGNGRWTGVPLRAVLDRAGGLKPQAREIVFFGADRGQEEVEFRTQKFSVEQQYGRSMTREQLVSSDAFLAWGLNGEPLTRHQGSPLRLLVPGWYGMANVKWLAQVHAQEDAYLGKMQARHYRTLRGETIDGEVKWTEAGITTMQPKSFLARVTKNGSQYTVLGVALHDGTPLKSVEVRVDDGPWQPAAIDPATRAKYSWKLFTYAWNNPAPGEHTLVSRVVDASGRVQPTSEELESKKTFLEDNSQYPRKVTIAG
jgi:DMSO/TMAO reductase YedYZ molybdopterin-dependent catalytic subunit